MSAPIPIDRLARTKQPQIGFMDERRRLQRLARFLTGKARHREFAKLFIHQR